MAVDERIRLFCALRLPDAALDALVAWQASVFDGRGRLVPREHLHVTLAFLGSRPRSDLAAVCAELRAAAAVDRPPVLVPERYRETRSVGMLVCADAGGSATALAADLHGRLERLGLYRPEPRPWLPHVTVLRFGRHDLRRGRPPSSLPPGLERFTPSDAAAYLSRLSPTGAQYEVLETVALGG